MHQGVFEVLRIHTCNGLDMRLYVSVSVEQALTVKANVATHHKWYQPLIGYSRWSMY